MSDVVGNPEDRFTHNEAHMVFGLDWYSGYGETCFTLACLCNRNAVFFLFCLKTIDFEYLLELAQLEPTIYVLEYKKIQMIYDMYLKVWCKGRSVLLPQDNLYLKTPQATFICSFLPYFDQFISLYS